VSAITFYIPGTPVPKGRPRFARRGAFVTTYTDDKTASYENLVKIVAQQAMKGAEIFTGAVSVFVSLNVTPPASWSQKKQKQALDGQIFPTSKPDVDNVVKGIFDALNDIVWKDDKQVCDVTISKRYSTIAQAVVSVSNLSEVINGAPR
jgi:Holliday junction resolvase RusA-like endonuclease